MSTGQAPIRFLFSHTFPRWGLEINNPGGPRGPPGPNSPVFLENLAQPVTKNVVSTKMSPCKLPVVNPGRHLPFPRSGVLTTVLTTAKRMQGPLPSPGKGSCLPLQIISQRAEEMSHLAKGLLVQCFAPERYPAPVRPRLLEASRGWERSRNASLPKCKE